MILKFKVYGMTCAACSARVQKVTEKVDGVGKVEVNLLAGAMAAEVDNADVAHRIMEAVERAGYRAELPGKKELKKPIVAGINLWHTELCSLRCFCLF